MVDIFKWVLGLSVSLVMMLVGLVFFAGVLSVAAMLFVVWLLRAFSARLTGKPVSAWTFRVNRQAVWGRFYRAPGARYSRRPQPADDKVVDVDVTDVSEVTDVEAKKIK